MYDFFVKITQFDYIFNALKLHFWTEFDVFSTFKRRCCERFCTQIDGQLTSHKSSVPEQEPKKRFGNDHFFTYRSRDRVFYE